MATTELSLFSIEILGLVGREGVGPHVLLRMAQRDRMLAWAGESQYYTEPKRLAKLGYLSARREPGKTRERTVYALTDKGLRAMSDYARTPVTFTPVKSDALLRLLICDLVGEDVTSGSIATYATTSSTRSSGSTTRSAAPISSPTARNTCSSLSASSAGCSSCTQAQPLAR